MTSQVYEPKGYRFDYVPADRVRRTSRDAPRRRHAPRLDRDAVEPAAEHRRHPRAPPTRRTRPARCSSSTTRSRRRTCSGRSSSAPTSSSTRRRSTSAATRTCRRLRGDERPDARRAPPLPAEVARRRARAVRLLARAARDQDARPADAAALRERDGGRRVPRAAPARRARVLPGAADASGPRDRGAADARLRRHGLVPRRVARRRRSRSSRARSSSSSPSRSAASRA